MQLAPFWYWGIETAVLLGMSCFCTQCKWPSLAYVISTVITLPANTLQVGCASGVHTNIHKHLPTLPPLLSPPSLPFLPFPPLPSLPPLPSPPLPSPPLPPDLPRHGRPTVCTQSCWHHPGAGQGGEDCWTGGAHRWATRDGEDCHRHGNGPGPWPGHTLHCHLWQ